MNLTKKEKEYSKKVNISFTTLDKIKGLLDCKNWIEEFESNPYQLIDYKGFGFKTCDNYAQKIGFDMKSPLRIKAYIIVAVEESSSGDSILELPKVIRKMEKELGVDRNLILQSIFSYDGEYVLLNEKHKSISKKDIDSGILPLYITKREWYNAEKFVFNYLNNLGKEEQPKVDWNIIDRLLEKNPTLNPQQRKVVEGILEKNVNLLIGVSGSGKSYVTRIILDLLDWHKYSYTLLAPTGIASFNLSEKVGRETSTVHRKFFKQEMITTDYLIIDEIGMCGYEHFKLLQTMLGGRRDVKIIFIGDKYQLPSITAGDFLASIMNLIKCNRINGNIFELTQVMRSSDDKDITTVCNQFCGYNRFDPSTMSKKLKGVEFLDRESKLFPQIEMIMKRYGWSFKDTAIIMPQRKGDNGCEAFNKYIQDKNSGEILYQDKFRTYKKGDILMHIKNNNELNIYNGEMVELLGEGYLCRKLYDGTELLYSEEELLTETTLGYSFTVHKSQGCTIKNVIFVAISDFQFMLSRNLMYVGMSRASDNLVVVCDKDVVVKSSYKSLTDKRKTFLNLLCK